MQSQKQSISIVTATFNNSATIQLLIDSLCAQTDKDFEWIICDGGSSDNTIELITKVSYDFELKLVSEPDFGIYDALNKGIKRATNTFYLTVGADDTLDPKAIYNYKQAINTTHANIILACVVIDSRIIHPVRKINRFLHQKTFVAGHSVGTLIRRDLHETLGFYNGKYPIAADHLFLELARCGGVTFAFCNFIAGTFGTSGLSSKDKLGALTEAFRIHVEVGGNKFVECIVFFLRLLWNYRNL